MAPAEKRNTEDAYEAKNSGIFVSGENSTPESSISVTEKPQPNDFERLAMLLRAVIHDIKGQLTVALMNIEIRELEEP